MTTTIKTRSNDLLPLLLFAVTLITVMSYMQLSVPHYLPISKIEEGAVVVRDDSVTTVVIPDIR